MQPARRDNERESTNRIDGAEFAALFQKSYKRMWLVAAGMTGDRTVADDIVQEAALLAWSKRDQFRRGSNFPAWLVRFVRWNALNLRRKRSKRNTHAADPVDLDRNEADAGTTLTDFESDQSGFLSPNQSHFDDPLVHALQSVSDVGRACILLRTIHQLSYREIAELLDIPEGTAMSHVHRTRQVLREKLQSSRGKQPPGSMK